MKTTNLKKIGGSCLLLLSFLLGSFTINAQHSPLKLTLKPRADKSKFKDRKTFDFWIENTSGSETIPVLVALEAEVFWGGYKALYFTELDGKVAPPESKPLPMLPSEPKNKGIVDLKPGESIKVDFGFLTTPTFGVYKLWAVYVQDPATLTPEYRKKLGKKADKLQAYELHSDTLTYDFTAQCAPLEKELDYKSLLEAVKRPNSTVMDYTYKEYGVNEYLAYFSTDLKHLIRLKVASKEEAEMIPQLLPMLKNVRGLHVELAPGEAIPNYVKQFPNLISLTIRVKDNQKTQTPLEGLEQLAMLQNMLQHLELQQTFIKDCPQWITTSNNLRSLHIESNAFLNYSEVTKIPNLEVLSLNIRSDEQATLDLSKATKLEKLSFISYKYGLAGKSLLNLKKLHTLQIVADRIERVPALTGLNVENLTIKLEDNLADHYPVGMDTLHKLKQLNLTGCFNNTDFPDLSACTSLEFADITDRSMTVVSANLKSLQTKVPNFKLRAPKVPKE
ncbi:hypothetical protein M2459_002703 [Parabacteroides sp. PF5-5]|uniref:hypothetical protein n=1 Tax=unclassified Parabacteroides TaxID=2649774 RepID=UPI0024753D21|nr:MULTISPECIES: hypothetical protein [unclassified Parabacteroides]MDH6305916.1 hypothetical protein [Parabacteroides sp. PH5-39]MDH6316869.1 hypothetical protein [Parabacteroides sp. PF5-13]MDH6320628.1 hypothetical protein [Parabacteroides sp. PH5-13]MDH6324451.1 hypothetical protein [Parabacteroides sp. PH5-8]MDH6328054.1 hypothetical protein [Parabacteroides sp. PH5-41]